MQIDNTEYRNVAHAVARYVLFLVVGTATAYGGGALALSAAARHPRGLAIVAAILVLLFIIYDRTKEAR